ncbi:MalY/PatB family protein [Maricaulis sp.]|uniref:MalY/PatB family protein n=1 Tax=Maricaulis sp. TaxID=1486257 RepID=UPI003A8F4F85
MNYTEEFPQSIFDEVIERKNSNSMKWAFSKQLLSLEESAAEPLPMWVADTDFRAPKPVLNALYDAVEHGVFGYPGGALESYVDAVINWQKKRFSWAVQEEWVVQTAGIITSLKTAIQAFSNPGDSVLIQPPVYSHFHNDVLINGRQLALAPLERVDQGYRFNPEVFEDAIQANTKIFILSNPHNPTGNVWSEEELRIMGEICFKHGILVISDEIHQDLIMNPLKKHTPFASLGREFELNSLTCTAPSKTFNLPGLQCANVFIPNKNLRNQFARLYERNMFPLVNTLGMVAAEAAYTHCEKWVDAMVDYVRGNHDYFAKEVNAMTDRISVLRADSLYLSWIDCRKLGFSAVELDRFMLTKARLWLDKGQKFGQEGHGYMRVNLGCPRSTVEESIRRLRLSLDYLANDYTI